MSATLPLFAFLLALGAGFLLGCIHRRQERRGQAEEALASAQHLAALRSAQLAHCERALLHKDAIITDLVDHGEALNREIDQLRRRLAASREDQAA